MPFKFCEITHGKIPVDVFIFHGYRSSVDTVKWFTDIIMNLGYTLVMCEYYGHGDNEGDRNDVYESMLYVERAVMARKNPVVLIGHSLGGALALSIGARLGPQVVQVFAVSAPNGVSFMAGQSRKYPLRFVVGKLNPSESANFAKTMPMLYGSCKPRYTEKYYLVHCGSDSIVPVSECYENTELFCIPDDHVFIKNKITGNGMTDHWLIFRDKETIDFITSNIIME